MEGVPRAQAIGKGRGAGQSAITLARSDWRGRQRWVQTRCGFTTTGRRAILLAPTPRTGGPAGVGLNEARFATYQECQDLEWTSEEDRAAAEEALARAADLAR